MPPKTKKINIPARADEAQALTVADIQTLINKKWPGAMQMASDPKFRITRIPCGILSIDMLLGGGFARGRHFELYGGYNVGKTYTTYRLIASAQSRGLNCAFVDVEGSFDPKFAKSAGVNLKKLALHRQEHGNRVIDFIETLLRTRAFDVIVLDSIAALLPQSELESDMEQGSYGTAQAKLMSAALRRLTAANDSTALVYINQTREAIGVTFGKRSVTSGGKAMGFYAGTRLEMVRTENIKAKSKRVKAENGEYVEGTRVKGHRVLVRMEKDKTGGGRPQDETTFVYDYDLGGIDHIEDLIYLGRVCGLIHKEGNSWWLDDYEDEKQGSRSKFKRWLRKNKAVAEELTEMITAEYNETRRENTEEEADDD